MTCYDLLLQGGTLVDPARGIHARRDVAFSGQRVARTVSKFLHLGLSLDEALAKVTAVPARVLGDAGAQIGTLAEGAWGDAVVLELREGDYDLVDCHKEVRRAGRALVPRLVVAGGRIYDGPGAPVKHAH